jgi:hypothetical protein
MKGHMLDLETGPGSSHESLAASVSVSLAVVCVCVCVNVSPSVEPRLLRAFSWRSFRPSASWLTQSECWVRQAQNML